VISAGLFVVTVVLVVFIFLKFSADDNKQEAKTDLTENILLAEENKVKLPEETQVAVTVGEIEKVGNIQKEESKEKLTEKKTTDKQSGPPPLPKSLVPIEAPLIDEIQTTVNNNVETDSREKNVEISNVPPKEEKKVVEEPTYFVAVEEMPEPIGGLKGIQEKIVYPEIAKRMGVEGKVHVQAFVDESGKVTDVQVIKGIGAGCDEAALDAVLKTKFKPGKQRGKPVRVQITIPINFKL
jgi:protein TonB